MFFCFTILKMIDIIFLKMRLMIKINVNNRLWKNAGFFRVPRKGWTRRVEPEPKSKG